MNPLLIALLGVMLLPLLIATWRASLLGLSCQGLLLAWIAYRLAPHPGDLGWWLTMADLVLVRGILAPLALYRVLDARATPARNDVIPPNLLSWTLAFALVLLAFTAAEKLVPIDGEEQTLVAVATTGVMLGFLVLSTQAAPFSQMVGALRIENAIALTELGGQGHHFPVGLHIALLAVFVATIALFRWYLGLTSVAPRVEPVEGDAAGPTL